MTAVAAFLVFFRLLKGVSPWGLGLVVVLSVSNGILLSGLILVIAEILSSPGASFDRVPLPVLLALGTGVFMLLSWVSFRSGSRLANRALDDVCDGIMLAVSRASLRQMEAITADGVMSGLIAERETLGIGLARFLQLLQDSAMVAGCMALLIMIQPLSAAILIMAYFVADLFGVRPAAAARRSRRLLRRAQARYRLMLGHVLYGIKSLKMNQPRRDALLRQGFLPALGRQGDMQLVARTRSRLQREPRHYAIAATRLSPLLVARFDTSAELLPIMVLSLAVGSRVFEALRAAQEMQTAVAALTQIDRLEAMLRTDADTGAITQDWPDVITVDEVGYTHAGPDGFHLGPISIAIRRGEILFISGGNGSGKTTLIRLITGLYQPQSGAILCDGEPLQRGERAQLFTAVFNDFHLARDLGELSPTAELATLRMLRRLGLAEVTSIENGRITAVNLSSGQRRRLALAVALIDDRPFCLFDEWTADQDPEFREFFYTHLLPELRAAGHGVIVVTHDDRYFDRCDRHVRLEEGRMLAPRVPA
jgi:putative ATP-binding cassette transporter